MTETQSAPGMTALQEWERTKRMFVRPTLLGMLGMIAVQSMFRLLHWDQRVGFTLSFSCLSIAQSLGLERELRGTLTWSRVRGMLPWWGAGAAFMFWMAGNL